MARRLTGSGRGMGLQSRTASNGVQLDTEPTRVDQLVVVIDSCTAAKDIADANGERLLSYLLAMAIQETRAAMRRQS